MKVTKPPMDKNDLLFAAGGVLLVAGMALGSRPHALITAGILLLIVPVLELVSGFIRGLRS